MQLKHKGQEDVIDIKQLTVSMQWTTAADFDLAAAYESKEGQRGLIYFGQLGRLDVFPYICLNKDEGVGDSGGYNEEVLIINHLADMNAIWLFCWDYGMVQVGKKARFKDSDVSLTISDDSGRSDSVEIDSGETGNVCYLACIDNRSPMGAMLTNTSLTGTLKGLKTIEQLMTLVKYQKQQWDKEGRMKGEFRLLINLLEKKFGTLDDKHLAIIQSLDTKTLLAYAEKILTAQTMQEVFVG
jgi:uncharacterized protein involved in tellurium resistance